MRIREIGYALLRVTLGLIFMFYGIGKFIGGLAGFAEGLSGTFAGKLPAILVVPFAYLLPFAETFLGLLILIGLFTPVALVLTALLLLALTFGSVVLGDGVTVAHDLQYAFVVFVLIWLLHMNRFSVDGMRGKAVLREPQ